MSSLLEAEENKMTEEKNDRESTAFHVRCAVDFVIKDTLFQCTSFL